MTTATIDEATKVALNNLPEEGNGYAFTHDILWYGIDAIVHFYLMTKAKEISEEIVENFMRKYDVNFDESLFSVGLEGIKRAGVFIPQLKKGRIYLFSLDYRAKLLFTDEYSYSGELLKRIWILSDLGDSRLIELGIKCGKDMWRNSLKTYEMTKDGKDHKGRDMYGPVPSEVQVLTEKLISYYSTLILELTPSE